MTTVMMALMLLSPCDNRQNIAIDTANTDTSALVRVDYLAADQAAGRYRTGTVDPVVISIPLVFELLVFSQPEKYLPELVQYFKYQADNEYHVIKLIHDWITMQIAYEFDAETDAVKLLALCRTNCVGYANLFRLLAGYAGIRSEVAIGYSRTYMFTDGRQGNHAWNVVWISGKKYLVDTTHDARMRVRDNTTNPLGKYSDDELFLNPEYKFSINLPLEDEYQLLLPLRSYSLFMNQPRVRIGFFKYGLSIKDQAFLDNRHLMKTPIRTAGISGISDAFDTRQKPLRISISTPASVKLRATMQRVPENEGSGMALQTAEEPDLILPETTLDSAIFMLSSPDENTWRVNIQARFADSSEWESVYSFILSPL